jgi:hypothetical protein
MTEVSPALPGESSRDEERTCRSTDQGSVVSRPSAAVFSRLAKDAPVCRGSTGADSEKPSPRGCDSPSEASNGDLPSAMAKFPRKPSSKHVSWDPAIKPSSSQCCPSPSSPASRGARASSMDLLTMLMGASLLCFLAALALLALEAPSSATISRFEVRPVSRSFHIPAVFCQLPLPWRLCDPVQEQQPPSPPPSPPTAVTRPPRLHGRLVKTQAVQGIVVQSLQVVHTCVGEECSQE